MSGEDIPRLLELAYEESRRNFARQEADLESARSRGGTIVAAATLVTSFLGAATLDNQDSVSGWAVVAILVGLLALVIVVAAVAYVLWPRTWNWGFNVPLFVSGYIHPDQGEPATLDEARETLVGFMAKHKATNEKTLRNLFRAIEVAVLGVGVEVLAWTIALVTR